MAFFSKSLRNWTKKHDFIEGLTEWSPTEYAELTEFIAEYSPTDFRNTQIVRVRKTKQRIKRIKRIFTQAMRIRLIRLIRF